MKDYAGKYYLESSRPNTAGDALLTLAVLLLAAGMLLAPLWLL